MMCPLTKISRRALGPPAVSAATSFRPTGTLGASAIGWFAIRATLVYFQASTRGVGMPPARNRSRLSARSRAISWLAPPGSPPPASAKAAAKAGTGSTVRERATAMAQTPAATAACSLPSTPA
jgi:hypothetical protein